LTRYALETAKNAKMKKHRKKTETMTAGIALFALLLVVRPFSSLESFASEPLIDPAGVLQVFPWVHYNLSQLASGHFPLWNPYTAMGQPHLANIQTALFFPLYWPWFAAGGEAAYGVLLLLRLWLAAMLWFVFARKTLCSFCGALIAAAAYGMGGYCLWFSQLLDMNSQMLLPLLLLAMPSLALRPRTPAFMAAAVLVCLSVLGGHPEAAFVTVLVAVLYASAAIAVRRPGPRPALRGLASLAAAGALGALLTAVVSAPFLNYLSRCWSMHGPGFGLFHLDPRGFFNLVAPGIHAVFSDMPAGIPARHIGKGPLEMLALPYSETTVPGNLPGAGLAVCGLAAVSLFRIRRLPWQAALFSGLLFLILGLTFGLPGFRLLALVPPLNLNSNFKFFFSEIHACLAVLAGLGADSILRSRRLRGRKWPAAVILAVLAAALWANSLSVRPFVSLQPREEKLRDELVEKIRTLAPGSSRVAGVEGFFPANLLLIQGIKDIRSSDAMFYRPYMELLNKVNRLGPAESLDHFYPSYFTRPGAERLDEPEAEKLCVSLLLSRQPWNPDSILDQVVYKGRGVYRHAPPAKEEGNGLLLHPPAAVSFSVADYSVRGEGKPALSFFPELRNPASDGAMLVVIAPGSRGSSLLYARLVSADGRRLKALVNIKRASTLELVSLPGPRNDPFSDWLTLYDLALSKEELPLPAPAWAYGDSGPYIYRVPHLPWAHAQGSGHPLPARRKAGDYVAVDLSSTRRGTLVVHEAWYPGWKVRVDGKPAKINVSEDKVRWLVEVPPGSKRAEFSFEPVDFRMGLFASLATLLVSLLFMIAGRMRRAG